MESFATLASVESLVVWPIVVENLNMVKIIVQFRTNAEQIITILRLCELLV